MKADHIKTHDGAGSECFDQNRREASREPMLIPVPRGMCSAFYQFMAAGCVRREDGQIMMLNPRFVEPPK